MINRFLWAIVFYAWNILIALDVLLNAILLGDPNETISSRAARAMRRDQPWWACWVCTLTDLVDPDHCPKAIEPDEGTDSWFSRMRGKYGPLTGLDRLIGAALALAALCTTLAWLIAALL